MSSQGSSDEPPMRALHITVRFTTSIPDLLLDVPNQDETTVVALKYLIRSKLDAATSKHRLRLIHGGKILQDGDILSAVVKAPAPPPRATDLKGKGKAIEEPPSTRVYINCSIGDELTPVELSVEATAATAVFVRPKTKGKLKPENQDDPASSKTTTPGPRGFDRLLSAGLTQAEVNQLRMQFLQIQSNIHTPDTMPSPTTLRQMEDAWIDDNAGATGAAAGEGGFDFGDDGLGGGALDDLLWGNLMGFLWPLGCVGWLARERGVWSRRRQIAVFTGFMLSVTFGILKIAS
ncbi:hypothetical protein BP5796_06378 [Coleophoma crateriformis]|uniref:Ubiquitin-like domain-containing protein n=1 Tax=Coleophoma crateriformis TaxID=565419 RepID=A0A3D8RNB7_9HELO|nr:hypothetical protein BP5796_06378 [Coleophoma crateriformis]